MSNGPIFLSASVPERDFDTYVPDPLGIREAIWALVTETVPNRLLVLGGHPAISPFVEHIARDLKATDNVRIYQSQFSEDVISSQAKLFKHLIWTPAEPGGLTPSLTRMRTEMVRSQPFAAAVFVGGMEGQDEEWNLFRETHPNAPVFPVASTEGAARLLWRRWAQPVDTDPDLKDRLDRDLQYRLLFRDILART
jgi:SLOG-like protein